ncbi:MAG: DUF4383 domain-containing protein [Pseudonocardiaceae bacterium]
MSRITPGGELDLVHRLGAAGLGVGLGVFGTLGLVNRLEFLSDQGEDVLGLSSNGMLATISLVVGGILIIAALRGGRIASTVTAIVGVLFLLSGLFNLAVLTTEYNLLAFRISNVIFSFVAGMLLLFLGAYGRFSGGLSVDNPYYRYRHPDDPRFDPAEVASREEEDRWVAAEIAVAEHRATPEQERLVREEARRRAEESRRRAWELYESRQVRDPDSPQMS